MPDSTGQPFTLPVDSPHLPGSVNVPHEPSVPVQSRVEDTIQEDALRRAIENVRPTLPKRRIHRQPPLLEWIYSYLIPETPNPLVFKHQLEGVSGLVGSNSDHRFFRRSSHRRTDGRHQ
jgi:hypothetical protein